MTTTTFAAIELPQRFGDVEGQLARVDAALAHLAPGVDLALLPEAILTGYVSPDGDFDLRRFAEPLDGPTAARVASLAERHGLAIAAPLVERDGDRFFNALLVFDRDGRRLAHYRKRRPWYPERWATPGDLDAPVFTIVASRVTVAICFDVHFLGVDARPALDEADVLLLPTAWVDDGADDARDALLPAVAREHDVAIVNANWGASSPRLRGQGASRIVDAKGDILARGPTARALI